MKICVQGLWHLGSVTAACLASVGHNVVGLDSDSSNVSNLSKGKAPIFEPGLDELLQVGIDSDNLSFTTSPVEALTDVQVLWVAFDTPVDDDDKSDVEFVQDQIQIALPFLAEDALVIVSSQLPVGSIHKLETYAKENKSVNNLYFACIPENLRLGDALNVFLKPDRVVIGLRGQQMREVLQKLISPITEKVEWMSLESAEMTKHAINAFLATSVTFANELAVICEVVGADAKEVERGLKTESRIGPRAYLSPGGPFAGGTLARDVTFLANQGQVFGLSTPLLASLSLSNDKHKKWVQRKLKQHFCNLSSVKIAIWGLTYKPGTNTLRRSLSIELCDWLLQQGAEVQVYDPSIKQLPEYLSNKVIQCKTALDTVNGADALVVGTAWPEFREVVANLSEKAKPNLIVIDANRHLQVQVKQQGFNYLAVGTPLKMDMI